jgi:hypothetical protein
VYSPSSSLTASAVCMQKKYTHTQISKGKNISSCPFFLFYFFFGLCTASAPVCTMGERSICSYPKKNRERKKSFVPFCFPVRFALDIYLLGGRKITRTGLRLSYILCLTICVSLYYDCIYAVYSISIYIDLKESDDVDTSLRGRR